MPVSDDVLEAIRGVDDTSKQVRQLEAAHRKERNGLLRQIEAMSEKLDLLVAVDIIEATPPSWTTPKATKDAHRGIANLILSDLHLDEVVKVKQVSGVNAFNRKIALLRLQKTFEKFVTIGFDFIKGIDYDGAHIWMLGDTFSGNIHEELRMTNEVPIMASLDFWIDPMIAGLKMVADAYGTVHVSVRVGNHGRNTLKPIMKGRVEDNFDWLFARILQRALADDKRITWDMPLSPDGNVIKQYSTRFLATHGDQFNGGSGISGIFTPLSLGDFRKSRRQLGVNDPYDVMLIGHFHQYMTLPRVVANGSLKGYDEYAFQHNFGFEVPQQAFWVTTPEHGPSFGVGIKPMDKKAERW